MTTQSIFVASDLHISRQNADAQLCSAESQRRLAEFIRWVCQQKSRDRAVHLVWNGDSVDFLVPEKRGDQRKAFISDEQAAARTLTAIMKETSPIWDALCDALCAGVEFSLLLGNHDIELSFPACRRVLQERLKTDRFRFIYNNEALTVGPVLIEHGNRYDAWNKVNHGALRAVHAALSRGETPPSFSPVLGSRLVVDVMNAIKTSWSPIDLLKPDLAAINMLLASHPSIVAAEAEKFGKVLGLLIQAEAQAALRHDTDGIPLDSSYIGLSEQHRARSDFDEVQGETSFWQEVVSELMEMLKSVQSIPTALAGATQEIAIAALDALPLPERLNWLYKRLRKQDADGLLNLRIDREVAQYRKPAEASAGRGFKLIVYGHTHLAKRVSLTSGGARYLNSGTWADLMWLPPDTYSSDKTQALTALAGFVEALQVPGRIKPNQVPTFVRIEMGQDDRCDGSLYLFRDQKVPLEVSSGSVADLSPQ